MKILKKCLPILIFSFVGCATSKPYAPKVWFSNPTKVAIERNKQLIQCESTSFQGHVCLTQMEFTKLYEKCTEKSWYKFW